MRIVRKDWFARLSEFPTNHPTIACADLKSLHEWVYAEIYQGGYLFGVKLYVGGVALIGTLVVTEGF